MRIEHGSAKDIPNIKVRTPTDIFENAIREYGVVAACEWFGYESTSDFTADTIRILIERTEQE